MQVGTPRPMGVEKPEQVDLAQAARYFGAGGEPDQSTMALLERCAVPLLAAAQPRAVWLQADALMQLVLEHGNEGKFVEF